MKLFEGKRSELPARAYDDKGPVFDDDVYQDSESGFQVLAYKGEQVTKDYFDAVMAGIRKEKKPAVAPQGNDKTKPKENKLQTPSENKTAESAGE